MTDMSSLLEVRDNELDETLSSLNDQMVALLFWAPWHKGSVKQKETLCEIGKTYEGRIRCLAVNVDENAHAPHRYEVKNIPHVVLIQGGRNVNALEGRHPSDKYKEMIESHLADAFKQES